MKIVGDDICGGQHGGISLLFFYISKLLTLNLSAIVDYYFIDMNHY